MTRADCPSIKAVIGVPDGLQALPGILTGSINPSGRTVDIFAADALASPAAQSFGDACTVSVDVTNTSSTAYKTGTRQTVKLVTDTIRMAKRKEKVTVELQLHSDQGFQYTPQHILE